MGGGTGVERARCEDRGGDKDDGASTSTQHKLLGRARSFPYTDEAARAPWPGSQGSEGQTGSGLDLSNTHPGSLS